MMSKRATMPLIMAVQAAPMALTMAMSTLPMVRKMDLIYWWSALRVVVVVRATCDVEAVRTQETTAPMVKKFVCWCGRVLCCGSVRGEWYLLGVWV